MPLDGDRTAPGLAVARWHPAPSIRVFEIKEALAVVASGIAGRSFDQREVAFKRSLNRCAR
jgi:hypothetical protein